MFYKAIALIAMALFFGLSARAQDYRMAGGLRASYGGLLTFKYKLNESYTSEAILALRWGGVEFTGLIERYAPAFDSEVFTWYYGGGMHLGIHGRDNRINPDENANKKDYINLGADLIGGLEANPKNFPIQVSLDYKPSFHFTGERWFVGEGIGLSLRYIFE